MDEIIVIKDNIDKIIKFKYKMMSIFKIINFKNTWIYFRIKLYYDKTIIYFYKKIYIFWFTIEKIQFHAL